MPTSQQPRRKLADLLTDGRDKTNDSDRYDPETRRLLALAEVARVTHCGWPLSGCDLNPINDAIARAIIRIAERS